MTGTVITLEGVSKVEKLMRQIIELDQSNERGEIGELEKKVLSYGIYGDEKLSYLLQVLADAISRYSYSSLSAELYRKFLLGFLEDVQNWCKEQRQKI